MYPLVNVYIAMENHNFQWENPLKMAIFNSYVSHYQRVKKSGKKPMISLQK